MNKEIIKSELTDDSYIHVKHKSGLDIYIWEMEGFSTVDALFGTRYGSINTRFKLREDKEFTEVPEGIAHFLEHKLFENEDCDAFEQYAKTGASANAYTSFDKTCYLFSCTDNYEESLKILLTSVQSPYFTKESVDKEQGIIAQEIKMCNDSPDNKVFFNLMKCLYHVHPVRIDIAGTVESISKIDADLLYKCYNTFYNLNNMVLVIAGNVKADDVLRIADECLKPCEDKGLEVSFPDEPANAASKEITEKMSVGLPVFNIGYKSEPADGYEGIKSEFETYIASHMLSDSSSKFYNELMDAELINSTFYSIVYSGNGFFVTLFGGESKDPHEVDRRIKAEIERIKKEGIDDTIFENFRKCTYGQAVRDLNNTESTAQLLLDSFYSKVSAFDGMKILKEMKKEDVMKCFEKRFDPEKSALSIAENKEESKTDD